MAHFTNPIVDQFPGWTGTACGQFVYDFFGVRTDPTFKDKFEPPAAGTYLEPKAPTPNTAFFELETIIECALRAEGRFVMAELGAGYGLWCVRAGVAVRRLHPDVDISLIAVEAEPTHFEWLRQHLADNGFDPEEHRVWHGAVTAEDGSISFPKLARPDADYGAAVNQTKRGKFETETMDVPSYSLKTVLEGYDVVDVLHIDIQGAEDEALRTGMDVILEKVKLVYVATHSREIDQSVSRRLKQAGLTPRYRFPWRSYWDTIWGPIRFKDGCHIWVNPAFAKGD